jgi:hypothetical protein
MTVANTTLLGLVQPTTGSESGVWGDDVNYGLTSIVDISVAGTNNITQDSDITLSVTNGNNTTTSTFPSTATNSTVAQYAVLNCTGIRTANRNIIAPASSKMFLVTNATTGGYAITVKKSAGTGVSIANGETALVYYNIVSGDYAKATSISTSGVVLPANGGTGVANGANNTITFTGNYTLGVTLTANTSVTFPTTGTLATLAGSETFTNKTLTNPTVTNYVETLYAPSAGTAFSISLANGTIQEISLNGNGTITLPSSVAGKSYTIIVTYSGSYTLTWAGGGTLKWSGGTTPTATSTSGKYDIFNFYCDGTNTYGSVFGLNF